MEVAKILGTSDAVVVERCRLCAGELRLEFSRTVLGRYSVNYFLCRRCESLQTEQPFWLEEAYSASNLSILDTGAAQRNLQNLAISYLTIKLFGVSNVLDIGGGDGLLCRLLRDYGVNCYITDSHTAPVYAQGYNDPDLDDFNLVTAFEVVEHFANPARELDEIFDRESDVVLLSTSLYKDHKEDWWYLAPESGQHVFFYSESAMKLLADRYGYNLVASHGYFLFFRGFSVFRARFFKVLMQPCFRRGLRALIMLLPARGAWRDHESQRMKLSG